MARVFMTRQAAQAGRQLDRVLRETIDGLRSGAPLARVESGRVAEIGERDMAELGGKGIGADFRGMMAAVRDQIDQAKREVAGVGQQMAAAKKEVDGALTEFREEISGAQASVAQFTDTAKEIRAETAEMRAAFRSGSNQPPASGG